MQTTHIPRFRGAKTVPISLEIHSFQRQLMSWANERCRGLFIGVMRVRFFLYSTNEAFPSCWREEILILHSEITAGLWSCRTRASGRSFSIFWIKPPEFHSPLIGALQKNRTRRVINFDSVTLQKRLNGLHTIRTVSNSSSAD